MNTRCLRYMSFTMAAAALLRVVPTPAAAQAAASQADAPPATGDYVLQEVVVTAEKRKADLQKTPVAVTAVSQDELVQNGVTEVTSIQKVAPEVNITNSSDGPTIAIRGLYTTQGNNPGAEGVVAMYFDGGVVPQVVLQGLLFDLQRVEIDKGPQTTLFGKDAEAGAINFITNKPLLGQTSGNGELEFGDYQTLRTEGAISLPVGNTFAMRLAAQSYSHRGYMDSGLDDADVQSGRLTALWQPNSSETLTIVGDFATDNSRDDEGTVYNMVGEMPGAGLYIPPNPRDDTFYNGYANGPNSPFHTHSVTGGALAENAYDFGFATWTTILSYRRYALDWVFPNSLDLGAGPVATAPNGNSYPSDDRTYISQVNQTESLETRLASDGVTPWQWVGGVYLYRDYSSGTMISYPSDTALAQSLQIGNPYELAYTGAVFGQATYTPDALPALHLTFGGRGEADYKKQENTFTQLGPMTVADIPESSNTWRKGTYRVEVGYDLTRDSMVYADTATAFRAGGYSYGIGQNPAVGPVYKPEYVTAYEIGDKNRFLGETLQANLEAWIYDYKNFENVLVYFACSPVCGGLPTITTADAGRARYAGATADIRYLITRDDELKVTYSWLYAKYGAYVQQVAAGYSLAPGAPVTSNSFLSNTNVANVPRSNGIASYAHTWRDVLGGSITARVAGQFESSRMLDIEDDPVYGVVQFKTGGWVMGDASLSYQPRDASWSVQAYCHNLANRLVPLPASSSYSTSTHGFMEAFYPPRVLGVIISGRF